MAEKNFLKPTTDEHPIMIVIGVIAFYVLIAGFIFYLYFLGKISMLVSTILILVITLLYIPRFLILKKLKTKDKIKITDNLIIINENPVELYQITDFRVITPKPQVVFFINNKMIVFQQAQFDLKLSSNEIVSFNVIGTEKISLMKEFLNELLNSKTSLI